MSEFHWCVIVWILDKLTSTYYVVATINIRHNASLSIVLHFIFLTVKRNVDRLQSFSFLVNSFPPSFFIFLIVFNSFFLN